ncbi:16S rRNA (cytidine(1402)-2'-O)-methyltransferase [Terriglobus albidus]|uniref:16S rRNA (cytidine(1402)-2'-O)-methyltransferase n=1 Tax=Terriglobus albidus TaxID=1592106 RepID=UPI0021DFC048|nr:16S rRNA (cytidine(1402)-2'-O)-methyltransferase [Terriglobus albidus]
MSEPAPLAPGLYLVATPIGNLEDITLRALRVLQSVDRIACEDTRQTQKLLNHFQIQKPTISYHQHNERSRSDELLSALQSGQRIAIVSDAGTPGIADPGAEVVAAAIAAGIPVYPIPGANAAISALIASGLSTESFTFHGFLPPKAGQRRTQLESLMLNGTTHIFYEAPHRIVETLEDVAAVFGPEHPVALARELTKLHEEHLRGIVIDVLKALKNRDAIRGEFVLLLSGERPAEEAAQAAPASIASTVETLMKQGFSEKDALKQVARDRNMGKSEVYRQWQREKTRR